MLACLAALGAPLAGCSVFSGDSSTAANQTSTPRATARLDGPPEKADVFAPREPAGSDVAREAVAAPSGDSLATAVYPEGPREESYTDEMGELLVRRISRSHPDRGWWADDDGTRALVLSRTRDGVVMHFLTAQGRRGPVEYAFDPPLLIMPNELTGEPIETSAMIRYGSPDVPSSRWDEGEAVSTIERLGDGRVRTELTMQTGRSKVSRVSVRTVDSARGVTREERSLRVIAFGMTVRSDDQTLERSK